MLNLHQYEENKDSKMQFLNKLEWGQKSRNTETT